MSQLEPSSAAHRILIVEDDLTLQPLLERMIRKMSPGTTIDWLTSAEDAFKQLSDSTNEDARVPFYSVVLSDINLAGKKSGIDLVEDCSFNKVSARFVMASGTSPSSFLKTDSHLPFVAKPFRYEELKKQLSPYLYGVEILHDDLPMSPAESLLTGIATFWEWLSSWKAELLEWSVCMASTFICIWAFMELAVNLQKLPFSPFVAHSFQQVADTSRELSFRSYLESRTDLDPISLGLSGKGPNYSSRGSF